MRKVKLVLAGLGIVAVMASGAVSYADAPGYCKKQGPSNCNGNSECAGPHRDDLPNGQAKKCGK